MNLAVLVKSSRQSSFFFVFAEGISLAAELTEIGLVARSGLPLTRAPFQAAEDAPLVPFLTNVTGLSQKLHGGQTNLQEV